MVYGYTQVNYSKSCHVSVILPHDLSGTNLAISDAMGVIVYVIVCRDENKVIEEKVYDEIKRTKIVFLVTLLWLIIIYLYFIRYL